MILRKWTIPDYIRKVKVSDSRRTLYYERGRKTLPTYLSKGLKEGRYEYMKFRISKTDRYFLVKKDSGERVIANPRTAGKERFKVINGQYLYKSVLHPTMRAKMMEAIKDSLRPHITGKPIALKDFPVMIQVEIHDYIRDKEISSQLWDLDNRFWPYQKAFQDLIVGMGIIPEDNIMYITGAPAPVFYPVKEGKQRKLVFKIVKDERKLIKENDEYTQYLARPDLQGSRGQRGSKSKPA